MLELVGLCFVVVYIVDILVKTIIMSNMQTLYVLLLLQLEKLLIGHDGAGIGSGWYIDSVTIGIESLGKHIVFPCNRWLATDEDDGAIERELYPVEETVYEKSMH